MCVFIISLVNETCTIALMKASAQANQFASAIDRPGNITNFTENRARKCFFFSRLNIDLLIDFCVCHKKREISGKYPIRENNTYVCSH